MKRVNGKLVATLLFGLLIFLFWRILYPYALSYQEQYQMFLFDAGYFCERMAVPGGLADYLAEFLTQFFVSFWIGSLILALLFMAFQQLTWQVAKCYEVPKEWYTVSFIPALLLWFLMGDENVMLSFLVALILLLLCTWGTIQSRNKYLIISSALLTSLLYWAIGPAGLFYGPMVLLCKKSGYRKLFFVALGISCLTVVSIQQLVSYPLYRLIQGINYYRFPDYDASLQWVILLFTACTGFLSYLPKFMNRKGEILLTILILAGGILLVPSGFDAEKYDLIEYDGLVRGHQWVKVIQKAQKKQPLQPMSVAAVNLALGMCDQLSDHLFEFYQNGTEGLFPAFQRDFTTPIITSEVYYQLGLVNTAQRYMFEAQEAIPNYRKSARITRRLAETNLINGKYKIARKYLRRLQKTLMYHTWAGETLRLIQDEQAVNSHPVYGKLRKLRLQKDFLFSDQEHDQMLGLLFTHDHSNKMALEYLLCHTLLQGNLEKFYTYYPLGKQVDYDHIPRAYQEALVYIWTQNHSNFQGLPWSISEETQREMVTYAQMYQANKNNPALKEGRFKSSFWTYYLLSE